MNCFFILYSNSYYKRIQNLISSAFGKILVLANAFFNLNSNFKSIKKLIFSAFGKILVLVNCFFFLFKFKLQKYSKIDFFSFWQDLGFGELLFFYLDSYYKSIQKLIFSAFGKILVLANAKF